MPRSNRYVSAIRPAAGIILAAGGGTRMESPDPTGYGRIIRDASGGFAEIVEESEATPAQRAITEVNSGLYAFEASLLADSVKRLPTSNAKGEEYLTDAVGILRAEGQHVGSFRMTDPAEVAGVIGRVQRARATHVVRQRMQTGWMRTGG